MAEPTIGEIVGRPDAELGTGQPAVNLDISSGLNAVTQGARDYSQNLLNRYALFQKTLGEFAQNHKLDFAGVMQEDIPKLKQQATDYFSKVASNPKMVTQIGQDPDWINLQTNIQKSKQDNSYLSAQEEFRRAHPDLYNQTNDDIVSQYRNTPLETRKAFNLDLPKTIDFQNLGKNTLAQIGESFSNQNDSQYPGYFLETKGKQYDLKKYQDNVDALYNSDYKVDAYGHTIKQYADDHYKLLPDDAKAQYEQIGKQNGMDGQEAWFQDQMQRQYKPFDINDTQLVENKYLAHQEDLAQKAQDDANKNAIEKAKLGVEQGKLGIEQGKLGLDWWKAKNVDLPKSKAQMDLWKSNTVGGEEQKNAAIAFTQNLMGQLENLATVKGDAGFIIPPNKIRQLSNEQLKYMGINQPKTDVSAGGLQPMQVTDKDAIEVLKNGQIRVLKNAKQLPDGRYSGTYDQNNNTSVQNIMTNRVNDEVKAAGSKELNAYLAPDLFGQDETQDNTTVVSQTPHGTTQTTITKTTDKGTGQTKTYNYKGKPFSQAQIEKAAQQSGMTVDQYLQKLGIK